MKKIVSLAIAVIMTVSSTLPVMAASGDVVIFGSGAGTQTQESTPAASQTQESAPAASQTGDRSKPYLALGADLTQEQLLTVLSAMGLSGTDVSDYNIVNVTNAEEHQYLDSYIDPAVIGTRSLSSVLVKPAESGHGINVTTYNINYCTVGMYKNALLTAGVEDADITVAAPTSISGTAALIGALKAYANMTGTSVNTKALDTSLNELVTTGQIEEALNGASKEDVEEMIAFIKAEIAGKNLNTRDEIDAAVREAIRDYNEMEGSSWDLTESEITQIVDLMVKIKELGLDYNTLLDQAADIYDKFGDQLTAEDLGSLAAQGVVEQIKSTVGTVFTGLYEGAKNFFTKLFSR